MKRIIKNNIKYDDYYYIELKNCSQDLLNKYEKPINKYIPSNAKKIKQINPISDEIIIFNSVHEANVKLGTTHSGINDAVKNKTIYNGSLWEKI